MSCWFFVLDYSCFDDVEAVVYNSIALSNWVEVDLYGFVCEVLSVNSFDLEHEIGYLKRLIKATTDWDV